MKRVIKFCIATVLLVSMVCAFLISFNFSIPADNAQAREIYNAEWDVFDELDYGLYFYNEDSDLPVKASDPNCNYDPTKPTIIYSHGWTWNEGFEKR